MPYGKSQMTIKTFEKYKNKLTVEEFIEICFNGYRCFSPEGLTVGMMYAALNGKPYGSEKHDMITWEELKERMIRQEKNYLDKIGVKIK